MSKLALKSPYTYKDIGKLCLAAALDVGELLPHPPLVLPLAVPGLSEVSAGVSTDPLWVHQVFFLELRPLATCYRRQEISLGGEAWLRLGEDLLTKAPAQAGYSRSTREALVLWWSVSVWLGRNCFRMLVRFEEDLCSVYLIF